MKSGNLLFGLMACAALCACTDNDIVDNGGNGGSQVFTGDVAYMVVNIKEVGTAATKAASNSFSTGTENAVSDIHFYFYDEEGNIVTVSTPDWGGTNDDSSSDDNIELTGKKIVVLHDLVDKIYPSYMVTVINQPSGFTTPQTLDEMQKALVDASDVCGTEYFTMSTSSYLDEETNSSHDTYYFATPVSDENFSTQPIDESSEYFQNNVVSTYVERLAAKVMLKNAIQNGITGDDLPWGDAGTTKLPDGMGFNITIPGTMERSASTRISVDLGGSGVDTSSTFYTITAKIYDVDEDGKITSSEQKLYIRFEAWGLNATAKKSYMVKNIDSTWDCSEWSGWDIKDDSENAYWNDATNHRSYWGKSYNYGSTDYTYPTSSSDITDESDYCLNYIAAADITNEIDGSSVAYCAENTNTAGDDDGIIQSKNSPAITSILVQATVFNSSGKTIDLVKYDSEYYTKEAYLTLALNTITESYPIYIDSKLSSSLSTAYLGLKNRGDGYVKVYIKGGSDGEEIGNSSDYYGADGEKISDPQALIDKIYNDVYGKYANEYKDGQMYYNVPIEHLNDDYENGIQEANYGVVRNHYYVVTLNSVSDLGRGIVDTDEPIVPQEEPELYYLGAEVQILSWREVSQGVDL